MLQIRSGNRGKTEQVDNVNIPHKLTLTDDHAINYVFEANPVGTTWEMDPVLGSDNQTIDLNISLNHHYAPVQRREVPVTIRGDTSITAMVADTYNATVTTQLTTRDGMTKMIGVWKPEGLEGEANRDVLHAAFVSPVIVKVLPLPNKELQTMLEIHGEAVLPTPKAEKLEFTKVSEEIPEGMVVRRFVVPPTFLSGPPVDPFKSEASQPRPVSLVTAKDVLANAGISFPEGSSANYLPKTSTLVVCNTPEQLDLVEAYGCFWKSGPEKMISIAAYIVEAPGPVLRKAAQNTLPLADHHKVWEEVQKEAGFSIINTSWIEARSGNRAKIESGRNYMFVSPVFGPTTVEGDGKKEGEQNPRRTKETEISTEHEVERIGTVLEVDPVIGADNTTIDLNTAIDFHYAPPVVSGKPGIEEKKVILDGTVTSFKKTRITAQSTMRSGSMRMLGMWRPSGTEKFDNADIMQAVFLKAEIVALDDGDEEVVE